MALTDTAVRNAKPKDKPYKLSDEKGMFLLVASTGGKRWRLKFRFGAKEQLLALGTYPDVPLAKAREKRDEARRLLADGINPSLHRKAQQSRSAVAAANTFEAIALEWIAKLSPTWKASHGDKVRQRLDRDVFPWIGKRPIAGISSPELLLVLRRIEGRGAVDTAHRAAQNCGQVFRYAIATGRAENDPCPALRGALQPAKHRHFASIKDPSAIGKLMRDIQRCRGLFQVQCALRLAPYVFVRPGELRQAEWAEINLDAAEWRLPSEKMKMKHPHIVPLSAQAVAILRELNPLTGANQYLFPGVARGRPISDNTINLSS